MWTSSAGLDSAPEKNKNKFLTDRFVHVVSDEFFTWLIVYF
jgi:hypothetical protein